MSDTRSDPFAGEPPHILATDAADVTATIDHGAGKHEEPSAFGLEPYQWVAVSMVIFILIALFVAKAHKAVTGGLDNQIAAIRQQLDEAKSLRAEAEALREEYAAKVAGAEKDAEAMLANAQTEADAIVSKAEADTEATITRRKAMAEDKIAAAERAAVDDLKARAANAATAASRAIIGEKHDAASDASLVDKTIASI